MFKIQWHQPIIYSVTLKIPNRGNFFFSLHANLVVIDANILELLDGDINYLVCLSINLCHI